MPQRYKKDFQYKNNKENVRKIKEEQNYINKWLKKGPEFIKKDIEKNLNILVQNDCLDNEKGRKFMNIGQRLKWNEFDIIDKIYATKNHNKLALIWGFFLICMKNKNGELYTSSSVSTKIFLWRRGYMRYHAQHNFDCNLDGKMDDIVKTDIDFAKDVAFEPFCIMNQSVLKLYVL